MYVVCRSSTNTAWYLTSIVAYKDIGVHVIYTEEKGQHDLHVISHYKPVVTTENVFNNKHALCLQQINKSTKTEAVGNVQSWGRKLQITVTETVKQQIVELLQRYHCRNESTGYCIFYCPNKITLAYGHLGDTFEKINITITADLSGFSLFSCSLHY